MATLRLPGLQTGIDTASLIQQLMEVQRRTLYTWENRKMVWENKEDALGTLEGKLTNLRSSVRSLSDSNELKAYNVSTSDDEKVTAEATNSAYEGNHTVVINQLANSERWVHSAGVEYAEDLVGAGTFIYSYNDKETTMTTTDTTTLNDLVGLINNDANNPGVTASLLYYSDSYHLVLNGNDAGTDYQIKINSGDTEVMKSDSAFTYNNDNAILSTKIIDLDQFDEGATGHQGDEYIRITGTDHFGNTITQTDLTITANTKIEHLIGEINDAFDGRAKAVFDDGKIILTDSTDGASSMTISLTYNSGSGDTDLTGLAISQTNAGTDGLASLTGFAISDFTKSQAAQDSKVKIDGFPSTSATAEMQTVSLSAVPASGTFTLTYRGETTSAIAYDATNTQIKTALEALSSVDNDDITVSGSIANGTTFTFANTLGDVDLLMINSSLKDAGSGDITAGIAETIKGSDGYISRSSNTVDDVVSGVALHLHDTTTSEGEQITLTRDIASVKEKLNSLVLAYNEAIEYIEETTGYDNVNKEAGTLMGDYVVSTIQHQLREPLIEKVAGFIEEIDTFLMPAQIGFALDRDGVLSFDENDFDEAIAEDYMGVLALIGADKTGSSSNAEIDFYGANNYTTAGEYNIRVTVSGGAINGDAGVEVKLSTESSYRYMDYSNGIATGISTLGDNSYPDYAECGLQLSIDETSLISQEDGTYTATVRVKQGFTGKIEDSIEKMLKATVGSLPINKKHVENQIDVLDEKIEDEEYRLKQREKILILRFARLERTIALLQSQMAAAGMISASM